MTGVSPGAWLGSILSRATSVDSSEPTMVAGISRPWASLPLKTTVTELAVTPLSLTTCALVRMSPSVLTTKPVPMPCWSPVGWPHMS